MLFAFRDDEGVWSDSSEPVIAWRVFGQYALPVTPTEMAASREEKSGRPKRQTGRVFEASSGVSFSDEDEWLSWVCRQRQETKTRVDAADAKIK